MKVFLTSDWHFSHMNIMRTHKSRREFSTLLEMNKTIIESINSVVSPEDTIFFLGDLAKGLTQKELFKLLKKINGNIVIIRGNHDYDYYINYLKENNYEYNGMNKFSFRDVGERLFIDNKEYYLTHYPMITGEFRPNIRNFCGHIHEHYPSEANVLNVGIDSPELPRNRPFGTPIELTEAMRLLENKWIREYDNFKD